VRLQLAIATGAPLPWGQDELTQRGHAIECRIYAEDPGHGFLPQAGRLLLYREPDGPGIRVDAGVVEGGEVTVHYDPLLAKLIVHAESREAAVRRAVTALSAFPVLGVVTNVPFLRRVLKHESFREGLADTGFIERHLEALLAPPSDEVLGRAAAAAATLVGAPMPMNLPAAPAPMRDPWATLSHWRGA
jgi:acetyl/propionyl-CoA carboxylase alpha subunit